MQKHFALCKKVDRNIKTFLKTRIFAYIGRLQRNKSGTKKQVGYKQNKSGTNETSRVQTKQVGYKRNKSGTNETSLAQTKQVGHKQNKSGTKERVGYKLKSWYKEKVGTKKKSVQRKNRFQNRLVQKQVGKKTGRYKNKSVKILVTSQKSFY